jgi:hypothetical protein
VLNSKKSSGDGGADVPPCIFDPDDNTYTIRSNQSFALSSSSKKTTAQNKSDDAIKGLNKLGNSLQELSRSSERVTQINADSADVQSLHSNIESLEARRMQLVLAKLTHIKNPSAAQVIDTEIGRIDTRLSEDKMNYLRLQILHSAARGHLFHQGELEILSL